MATRKRQGKRTAQIPVKAPAELKHALVYGHSYADCPSALRPNEPCKTCLIRKRREGEPDTWYFKPRNYVQAMNAVSVRYAKLPKRALENAWEDLERMRPELDPVVWTRLVLYRAVNFGVNVDHIPFPLGVVHKRPPKFTIPTFPDKPPLLKGPAKVRTVAGPVKGWVDQQRTVRRGNR